MTGSDVQSTKCADVVAGMACGELVGLLIYDRHLRCVMCPHACGKLRALKPKPKPKPTEPKPQTQTPNPRGAAEKKRTKDGSDVHCTLATLLTAAALKKTTATATYSVLFCFYFYFFWSICFNALFGRFVTRGVQKHEKALFFRKSPSGLITKNVAFFSSVSPPPSLGCLVRFFYRVFGRFATRGVQKRDKKNRAKIFSAPKKSSYLLTSLFFPPAAPLAEPKPQSCPQTEIPVMQNARTADCGVGDPGS
jgi:hypothetical protein